MTLNALLKTKERHTHRQWILSWLEDNYECKKGATICKAAVFSDYAEVCRLQTLKPVTNSLFGKLVKAVFPTIRTCRKGPRSDSRTHYAGLHRRRDTISLPRVCPETGELLPPYPEGSSAAITSFVPAPSSASSSMSSSAISEAIPLHSADCSLASSPAPSSPASLSHDMSPVSVVEVASGALPTFQFGLDHPQPHPQAHQQPQFGRGGHYQHIGDHRLLHHSHSAQFPSMSSSSSLSSSLSSFVFGGQTEQQQQQHYHTDQHAAVHAQQLFYSPASAASLSSCSSGPSTYDDALSEFEEMDLGGGGNGADAGAGGVTDVHESSCYPQLHLPLPPVPPCLCPSCGGGEDNAVSSSSSVGPGGLGDHEHESASLESVEDMLGDLEPRLLHLDPSMLHHLTASAAAGGDHSAFCVGQQSTAECCCGGYVPTVHMSSSMMAPPVAPSPPASPPPPLSLMSAGPAGEYGPSCGHQHQHHHQQQHAANNNKLRPFLRRTMAKASAQAAEGNPLAEGFIGVINTCQKIIKDRAQKRRRKSSVGDALASQAGASVKLEPHQQQQQQQQHAAKKQHTMSTVVVDANALVPPFVLSLEEIPGSQNSFAFQESVLVFANEYRKMYQAVFDRLVRFEYAILFDVVFSFWNQVKLQPNFSFLLDHESVKKQVLAYDAKVLHTFKDYFLMNPLKMSAQQFGGFLQTIAFHLPFSVERATLSLLPADLSEEKMRQLQTFAADLQGQAQSLTLPQVPSQPQQPQTVMEINNY